MGTRKFMLNLPILAFGLATIVLWIGEIGEYPLLNAYLGIITGGITLAYALIYMLYITYRTLFHKDPFDFYPLISLGLIIWPIFLFVMSR